jgi:hypothetical protein
VFGPDDGGGQNELDRAREVLEEAHFGAALRRPDLVGRDPREALRGG